jgi:F-box-like
MAPKRASIDRWIPWFPRRSSESSVRTQPALTTHQAEQSSGLPRPTYTHNAEQSSGPLEPTYAEQAEQRSRLAQPASTQLAEQPSRLVRLPVELLSIVFEFLPPESLAAVGLTSKYFFHIVSSTDGYHFPHTVITKQFLLLLEQALPNHLFCYTCCKLYNWRRSPTSVPPYRYRCPARRHDSSPPQFARLCGVGPRILNLQREVRDLILRADTKALNMAFRSLTSHTNT